MVASLQFHRGKSSCRKEQLAPLCHKHVEAETNLINWLSPPVLPLAVSCRLLLSA